MNEVKIDRKIAIDLLEWAGKKNPGTWIDHSYNVAIAAERIAEKCDLNIDLAYIFGLLHDIGRYEGVTNIRHVLAGYNLMKEKGYSDVARICLTHSFPDQNIRSFAGIIDCSPEEMNFIETEIKKLQYNDYDKLIQLCDGIGIGEGMTLLEIRIVDVVKRYGFNEFTQEKWKAFFEVKEYFEKEYDISIYGLFEKDIINTIFKRKPNGT